MVQIYKFFICLQKYDVLKLCTMEWFHRWEFIVAQGSLLYFGWGREIDGEV